MMLGVLALQLMLDSAVFAEPIVIDNARTLDCRKVRGPIDAFVFDIPRLLMDQKGNR
ncbi:hypothetical protein AK812_SmicGene46478, partial [Symbiodinium microadriaticum]